MHQLFIAVAAGLLIAADAPSQDAAKTVQLPKVTGVLGLPVKFPRTSREKVATTCLDLLVSCSTGAIGFDEQAWSRALRACHVRIKFPAARAVVVNGSEKVAVSEMVITFPLPSTGYVLVRSGDEFRYFAKYSPERCSGLQKLLKEATVADE
jgi:hypothetical protein